MPAVQLTTTPVTGPPATVPAPALTTHVPPAGWTSTVTLYGDPLATGVAKANAPLPVGLRVSPPLSCKTMVAPGGRPLSVPPTVYTVVAQLTATEVTLLAPTVPELPMIAHVWLGIMGGMTTVTA